MKTCYLLNCKTCDHETEIISDHEPWNCPKCGSDAEVSYRSPTFTARCSKCQKEWRQVESIEAESGQMKEKGCCVFCGEEL